VPDAIARLRELSPVYRRPAATVTQ
jgi:hypothetical protein